MATISRPAATRALAPVKADFAASRVLEREDAKSREASPGRAILFRPGDFWNCWASGGGMFGILCRAIGIGELLAPNLVPRILPEVGLQNNCKRRSTNAPPDPLNTYSLRSLTIGPMQSDVQSPVSEGRHAKSGVSLQAAISLSRCPHLVLERETCHVGPFRSPEFPSHPDCAGDMHFPCCIISRSAFLSAK